MSKLGPLVSCIIPVFNGEAFLGETIGSVLSQTHKNIEILVVDDGSTDASAAIAGSFDHVRVLSKPNGGAASARNVGIAHARGDFLAFLDADDIWLPGKISRQLMEFASDQRLGVCLTFMQNFWEEQQADEAKQNPELTEAQLGPGSSAMIRRVALDDTGPLDESLLHRDIEELMIRARLERWNVLSIREVWVKRRIHARNISRSRSANEPELLNLAATLIARNSRDERQA